jgi:hypothetical protein
MTKTLNQIFFFPPPKSEYFLRKKNHSPPLEVKWSVPYELTNKYILSLICFVRMDFSEQDPFEGKP